MLTLDKLFIIDREVYIYNIRRCMCNKWVNNGFLGVTLDLFFKKDMHRENYCDSFHIGIEDIFFQTFHNPICSFVKW